MTLCALCGGKLDTGFRCLKCGSQHWLYCPPSPPHSPKMQTTTNQPPTDEALSYKLSPVEVEFMQSLFDRYSEGGGIVDLASDWPAFLKIVRKHSPALATLQSLPAASPDVEAVREALKPFSSIVGKQGEEIVLRWGASTYTAVLKPEHFYRAHEVFAILNDPAIEAGERKERDDG